MVSLRSRYLSRIRVRIAIALLALASALPLTAQQTSSPVPPRMPVVPIDSGRLVRIHTDNGIITGRLTARFGISDPVLQYCRYPGPPCTSPHDTIAIRTTSSTMVRHLEISHGSRWRSGAIKGGVIGTVSMLVIGHSLRNLNCDGCGLISSSEIVRGSLAAGAIYAAFGALIGSAFPAWDD